MAIFDKDGGMNGRWMNVLTQIALGMVSIDKFDGKLDDEDLAFIEGVKRDVEKAETEGRFVNVTIPDFD